MTPPVTFEPFPSDALGAWIEATRLQYVAERVVAGDTRAEAEANAHASIERLFPGGSPAPGQLVGRLVVSGQHIGSLWIGMAGSDPERWWVWGVELEERHRGQGYGRQAMVLAETLARDNGARTLGLNVFGHNHVARALYASLGYQESAIQMRKALSP